MNRSNERHGRRLAVFFCFSGGNLKHDRGKFPKTAPLSQYFNLSVNLLYCAKGKF